MKKNSSTVVAVANLSAAFVVAADLLAKAMDHIFVGVHVTSDVFSQTHYRQPSKKNQNHPRISQNTCATTNSYESHSII